MNKKKSQKLVHPKGDREIAFAECAGVPINAYSCSGKVVWEQDANVTQFGNIAIFIDFLKTSKLFDNWVNSCPLEYTSTNVTEVSVNMFL